MLFLSDLDECALDIHDCDANAICTNTEGSFTCTCDSAAHYYGDGKTCSFEYRKSCLIYLVCCSATIFELERTVVTILGDPSADGGAEDKVKTGAKKFDEQKYERKFFRTSARRIFSRPF